MARLLFLGASTSQVPAIAYVRGVGHEVIAVDGDPNAVGFRVADRGEAVDFADVERVAALGRRSGVDGVLAISSDRAVHPAAAVARMLGLPGIDPDVALRMTDKAAMRRRLEEQGLPQPVSMLVHRPGELGAALAAAGLPAVVKPADSGGQRGVFRVDTAEEAAGALGEALAVSRSGRALVESFLDGVELNGIVVVRSGSPTVLTLSDRLRPAGAGFAVGWAHRYPSSLPRETLDEAARVAAEAVVGLGLHDGIGFPQLIADARSGVNVVEVAARIPAGQMADLVRHATGIELFDVALAFALGQEVLDNALAPRFDRPVAIRFLTAAPGLLPLGTVRAVGGLHDVRNAPGVVDAGLYFDVGEQLRPVQVDADRRGYIVATGRSGDDALRLADAASTRLNVTVESS